MKRVKLLFVNFYYLILIYPLFTYYNYFDIILDELGGIIYGIR